MNKNGIDIISGGGGILTLGGSINEPEFINNKGACIVHGSQQAVWGKDHATEALRGDAIPNVAWSKQQPLIVSKTKNTKKYDSPPVWANAAHGTAGQNCFIKFETDLTKYYNGDTLLNDAFQIIDDTDFVDFVTTPLLCQVADTVQAWGFGLNLFTCVSGYRPADGVGVFSNENNSYFDPTGVNSETGIPYNFQGSFNLNPSSPLGAVAVIETGAIHHVPTTGITLPILAIFKPNILTTVSTGGNQRGALHHSPPNGEVITVRSTTTTADDTYTYSIKY